MSISQEVIDIIIGLACKCDLKTSLRCVLVSKAFVPAARKETFYRLFIHDYTFGQPPSRSAWHTLPATLRFFRNSPHISSCPRVLCYCAHPDVSVARLKRLLSQLTRVHTLIIECSDTDVCMLPSLSPFLRNIYFRDCYISHRGMSRLLTSSQNVEKLCIVGNWVTSPTVLNRAYRLPVPPAMVHGIQVLALDLLDRPCHQLDLLCAWLAPMSALERLLLKVKGESDINAAQKLILANSTSLLKLRVAVMSRLFHAMVEKLYLPPYRGSGWSAVIGPLHM